MGINGYDSPRISIRVMTQKQGGNAKQQLTQRWMIKYVDTFKGEPGNGKLNRFFGLYVNRPFHIFSLKGKRRYVDMIGRNLVIKTPNGRRSQVFYFDGKTKTIKSKQNAGWSFDVKNSGRNTPNDMQMWNTNSNWW